MNRHFDRFLGVDFSGAREAGNAIWIAEGSETGGRLMVDRLRRARALPGGGRERAAALSALRAHLAGQENALIGLDFPFSLPKALIDAPAWTEFARCFAGRYPDAEAFRDHCRRRTGGREHKRRTDRRTATPFCAYNLRLYRQTYWGIAAILAPLAEDRRVAIVPVLDRPEASAVLAETCPASSLKRLKCYAPYKGPKAALAAARRTILDRLRREGLRCTDEVGDTAVDDKGGDALDALIAAATMWHVARSPDARFAARDETDALEARVFAWPLGPDAAD